MPPQETRPTFHSQKTVSTNRNNMKTVFREPKGFTMMLDKMLSIPQQDSTTIHVEQLVSALLLGLIFIIRATNLNFNTLHLDEAIYASVGEEFLHGVFRQNATTWMFGSYLYPVSSALASALGGVVGMRLLSAILSTITALFVYLTTGRIFGISAALLALVVFGFTGISINVGQHATYDSLGLALFAVSLYCAVSAILVPEKQKSYLRWAAVTFSLSVLAKYNVALLLTALIMVMLVLHLSQNRGLRSFITGIAWGSAMIPMIIILGIYTAYYFEDLREVLTAGYANQFEPRLKIFGEIVRQIGLHTLLVIAGLILLTVKTARRFPKLTTGLLIVGISILLVTILAIPLYHLLTSNARSMWKHNVYTLVLFAPVIGYLLAETAEKIRHRQNKRLQVFSAGITAAALLLLIIGAIRQNQHFHYGWPDSSGVIQFLKTQIIDEDTRILSSGYAIYDYYFDLGTNDQTIWNNVWYAEHDHMMGAEAVKAAIEDCVYDIIVLDNFWVPQWGGELMYVAKDAGYVIAYSTMTTVDTGDSIITNVFLRDECGR